MSRVKTAALHRSSGPFCPDLTKRSFDTCCQAANPETACFIRWVGFCSHRRQTTSGFFLDCDRLFWAITPWLLGSSKCLNGRKQQGKTTCVSFSGVSSQHRCRNILNDVMTTVQINVAPISCVCVRLNTKCLQRKEKVAFKQHKAQLMVKFNKLVVFTNFSAFQLWPIKLFSFH